MSSGKRFEILVVGASGVGKTSLAVRYKDGVFNPEQKLTIAVDTMTHKTNICGHDITLRIQDATGQPEKFQIFLTNYYAKADGVILVYDVTNQDSLKALESLLTELDQYANEHVKKIVLGNKTDKEPRKVSAEDGKELAQKHGAAFMETSAKENDNIKVAFEYLTQQLVLNSPSWLVMKYKTLCEMGSKSLPSFKILLLGNSSVGKTCLIKRYRSGYFPPYTQATVALGEDSFTKSFDVGDGPVKFSFWDTAGMERFRSMVQSYFRSASGAVFVYDVTNLESFQSLRDWLNELHFHCSTQNMKKIIVGNQTDKVGNQTDKVGNQTDKDGNQTVKKPREVSAESAREFARKNGAAYVETSAKYDSNIEIVFEYIVQQVLLCPDLWKELKEAAEKREDARSGNDVVKLENSKSDSKKSKRWWKCW